MAERYESRVPIGLTEGEPDIQHEAFGPDGPYQAVGTPIR